MPEEIAITAPMQAPAAASRDYASYLTAYLTKLRSEKAEFTAADLPTEAEARKYWGAGRGEMEAHERLYAYAVRRTESAFYYPDEKGNQVVISTPDGTMMPSGMVFYLPGMEKAALGEAKRRGLME